MKKISIFLIFVPLLLLSSCKREVSYTIIDATPEIRQRAYDFALLYEKEDSIYFPGGQDPLRSAIKMDCSGLVVMCYKYALVDTPYSLMENDMAVDYMYHYASSHTTNPIKGDLVFMGYGDAPINSTPTHIAIYEKEEKGEVYFIDSTEKDNINGITRRHYPKDDKRIKGYGIMKIKY